MIGGQQGNSLLELIKQGKLQKNAPAKKADKAAAAAAAAAASSRPAVARPTTTEVCVITSGVESCYLTKHAV